MTRARRLRAVRRGRWAETAAALLLRLKGYRIIARDLRTPVGEIDLVARRGRVLVLVEVKARGDEAVALGALRAAQRHRIIRAGAWLIARRPELCGLDLRCDVVIVTGFRLPRHLADAWQSPI